MILLQFTYLIFNFFYEFLVRLWSWIMLLPLMQIWYTMASYLRILKTDFLSFRKWNGHVKSYLQSHPCILKTLTLTPSWRRQLSYRTQSIDLLRKSMDWFLYENGCRHERVKDKFLASAILYRHGASKLCKSNRGCNNLDLNLN